MSRLGKNSFNKEYFIRRVSKNSGITRAKAEIAMAEFIDGIRTALMFGKKVNIVSLGTFRVNDRKEKIGLNNFTGEKIVYPARKLVRFTVSGLFFKKSARMSLTRKKRKVSNEVQNEVEK